MANNKKTLKRVLDDFNASWQYCHDSWHSRWEDNYMLYQGNRVKRGYEGITDTFVPMTYSTVETMVSALFGSRPKFDYLPPSNKPDQDTKILNGLLDSYWDRDQWSLKIINTGRGMLREGTAVDYFYWDIDHPVLINVPIRDFFIDPFATSLENARYMGRRYLTSKSELEEFEVIDLENPIVDPETGEQEFEMRKKYQNLSKVQGGGNIDENTDKQQKDIWYGSTAQDASKDQVEVIEYWTKDRVISIANRSVVIEDTENYYLAKAKANNVKYPRGIMPFADARYCVDASLFYSKGIVDYIADSQELLNDITNQNVDSITYTLNQMYAVDPKYAHLIKEIENLPGAVYPINPQDLQPIPQRPIPPDAFRERQNIKTEIRETTASNEVVKGAAVDGAKTTATEINAQVAGAGQRINLIVTQLENGYFHRVARIVFEMVKLYVTEPMMVRIIGPSGVDWQEFDPMSFQDDYQPHIQLDIRVQNEKEKKATDAANMLKAFVGSPDINQQELSRLVLQRSFDLDPDEVDKLLQVAPPVAPVAPEMAGDPSMAGLPPEGMLAEMMPA